ncbi:MAG TPA: hypothetical protein VES70_12865 [Pseudomonas sp.]|nr:hypothetical protein [Pseudomonas sp.]
MPELQLHLQDLLQAKQSRMTYGYRDSKCFFMNIERDFPGYA